MPKQKDLKRRVRQRMRKTGESYTAARARLLEKQRSPGKPASKLAPARAPAIAGDLAALAGMSDETVRAKTGRSWKEWVATLDAIDGTSLPHRELAERLYRDFDVPGWWAQMVTVGYERIRGLRAKGQRRGGGYEVGKSKVFHVPIGELYAAFGERERKRWLGDTRLTVRKATPNKTLRMRWADDAPVEVYFVPKGERKSQVAVQHRGLASPEEAAKIRAFWGARLGLLGEFLAARTAAKRPGPTAKR